MTLLFTRATCAELDGEIQPLIARHYDEIRQHPAQRLAVDYPRFYALEEAGALFLVQARDLDADNLLVGYVVHILARHLHYDLIQAHDDAHYLLPEYRRGMAALRMLRTTERLLKAAGVGVVTYHTKARPDLDRGAVFRRLGYAPVETIYGKFLED